MNKLKGKVAGTSKGIGASVAEHLTAEGATVVANYASGKTGALAGLLAKCRGRWRQTDVRFLIAQMFQRGASRQSLVRGGG